MTDPNGFRTLRWPPKRADLQAVYRNAINKFESLGSGRQLILHGNASAIARDFFPHMAVLRRHFCRMCISNAVCYFKALSVTISTSLRPVVHPLLGCSSGKHRSRPIGVRVCPETQCDFFSTAFDLREWTLVVFWKEDSGRQLRLINTRKWRSRRNQFFITKFLIA